MKESNAINAINARQENLLEVKNAKQDLRILSGVQAKMLDQLIIASGIKGFELMQRAANASLQAILLRWPHSARFSLFCGKGNNAGDAMVLAVLLQDAGKEVRCILVDTQEFHNEAQEAYAMALNAGINFIDFTTWQASQNTENNSHNKEEVLIDALFGIGLNANPNGAYAQAIEAINASKWQVCSLDLPSGLDCNNSQVYEPCIKADLTICFLALKKGMLDKSMQTNIGRLYLANLGFDAEDFLPQVVQTPDENVFLAGVEKASLPHRSDLVHKGDNGNLLIIGGDFGTQGAVGLTAQAALRSGAGLVKILTRQENTNWLLARSPEVMIVSQVNKKEVLKLLDWCDALVIGTGLGKNTWGRNLWDIVRQNYTGACVLDADALNLWAEGYTPNEVLQKNICITPHPKEAARLLGISSQEVQADRYKSAKSLMALSDYGILKGANSLVFASDKMFFSKFGNGGMATAGMGDLLAGMIGALLAQGFSLEKSSLVACLAHAKSGDAAAAKLGKRGIITSDLLEFIPQFLN